MVGLPSPYRSRTRTWLALGLGVAALVALTLGLNGNRGPASLTTAALLYLVPVVVVAVVGGVWPALAAAVASDALLNWFFVPPYHTFTVESRENVLELLIYVLVAVSVSLAVDLAARQRAAAVRSGLEARLLARITAAPVADQSLTRLLGHIRDTFGMRAVALVEGDETVAGVGSADAAEPALEVEAADGLRLVILAAVGHDLRTPLASIKAAASSLRAPDVEFSPEDRDELLATVEESADRLDDLVENLLAMSRLQAGVLAEDRERMFAPFQRLGDRTADGGLGLGLAIARGFTEAMGGRLTPADTPGGGLTMTVTLPR